VAVLLLDIRIARARRMTAVHVRIAAVHSDLIVVRCIACLGDTAVCVCPSDRGRRDSRELVTCVLDLFLVRRDADIRLALFIRAQSGLHCTSGVCTAEVDAVIVPHQGNVAPVAARRFHLEFGGERTEKPTP